MAGRLYGWPPTPPFNPIKVKPSTADSTGLFFFFILFAPFSSFLRTQGSGQLGFHSLFTVWACTGSWVLYNLDTHNIWHLHGVETHTHHHHRWRLSISFPSGQHIQFTWRGNLTYRRRRLQFNDENRRPDKLWSERYIQYVCFSRQQGNVSKTALDGVESKFAIQTTT